MSKSDPEEPDVHDVLAQHVQELRRGTVVLACLGRLDEPSYGYALLQTLEAAGFEVDGNTLYPLLRRLEKQGLLESEWNTDESRPRKFYRTTPSGRAVRAALADEWRALDRSLTRPAGVDLTETDHTGPLDPDRADTDTDADDPRRRS